MKSGLLLCDLCLLVKLIACPCVYSSVVVALANNVMVAKPARTGLAQQAKQQQRRDKDKATKAAKRRADAADGASAPLVKLPRKPKAKSKSKAM